VVLHRYVVVPAVCHNQVLIFVDPIIGDNHIAVTGGNACLSYGSDGSLTTQACGNQGVDQVWNLVAFGGSSGTTPPPSSTDGQQIRWSSNGVSGCLTVMDANLANFGRIAM
jgi:hypothetical protein